MANSDVTTTRIKAALPNLLLATTYALNKSNTKRVIVGLDYFGGIYKPVVKLCSSGSPSKYVTLDPHSWELIVDQMDAMTAFFQNSYAFYGTFGNPSRVYMPTLDLTYKTSYGLKSICIEERPVGLMSDETSSTSNANTNNSEHQQSSSSSSSSSSIPTTQTNVNNGDASLSCGTDMPQPCKKRRYEQPPSVTIQEPTFLGFKDVHDCIVSRMNYLSEIAVSINRMIDHIIIYLHKQLSIESVDKAKSILKDICVFAQFFKANYVNIHASARKGFGSTNVFKDQIIDILILELMAFGLPWIMKHVNELVQKS